MADRINLATCTNHELHEYVRERQPHVARSELVFAAGALNNRTLLKDLGSHESSHWYEGRRAADPTFTNPYY